MKMISSGKGTVVIIVCLVVAFLQWIASGSVTIWSGNVKVIGLTSDRHDSLALRVLAPNGKFATTTSDDVVYAYGAGKLPWLYCHVDRSGYAKCVVPKETHDAIELEQKVVNAVTSDLERLNR